MMMLASRDLAVQDRIVAVLREASEPMTTRQVNEAAGPRIMSRVCWPWRHQHGSAPTWKLVECTGVGYDLVAESLEVERVGYQLLVRLETYGIVRRRVGGDDGPVWWFVAGRREWDAEVDALDEILEAGRS